MFELNRPIDITLEDAIYAAKDLADKAQRQCVVWRVSKGGACPEDSEGEYLNYWLRFDDQAAVARLTLEGLDGYDMAVVYIAGDN